METGFERSTLSGPQMMPHRHFTAKNSAGSVTFEPPSPVETNISNTNQNTKVCIERAGLVASAAWPSSQSEKATAASPLFITTTATVPSGFLNAVEMSELLLGELAIRFAPGLMNFEKCPI